MGTVYTLPVIAEGANATISTIISNAFRIRLRSTSSSDTGGLYIWSNIANVKLAMYLVGSTIYRVVKFPDGSGTYFTGVLFDSEPPVSKQITTITGESYIENTQMYQEEYNVIDYFNTQEEALAALGYNTKYPITYRLTNCTAADAPAEAAVGETVVVPIEFPDGYGLANTGDIYVQCNGTVVLSTYENGQLTFTMPDPSSSTD